MPGNAPDARRQENDFLLARNHDAEWIDFHALRHTCGAWLAVTGAHPKVVQTIMRHSTITLTMDTYGHLFPGQEADAVARMRDVFAVDLPEAGRATGTDNQPGKASCRALQLAQQSGRETLPSAATPCDQDKTATAQKNAPKPLQLADLGDGVRDGASHRQSAPSRTRTLNLLIKSQLLCQLS